MRASVALAIFSRASGASRPKPRSARRAVAFRNREKSKSKSLGYKGMQSLSVGFNHDGAAPAFAKALADGSQQANPETKRLPTVALSPQGALPIIPAHDG
jgi:hypothetical protein